MTLLDRAAPLTVQPAAPRRWPNYRTPYRPDIEGLRAIAVLTVVAFHASVPGLSGGFVGVDVFFVISGFLITGLMLTEAADTGRISLREFYARRARRILPGAATVLVITGLASWLLLPLLRVRDVTQDLAMSALYVSNWRFISLGTDYLAQNRAPSPFLHFWSLAVEEQFYLVWPLILVGLIIVGRRLRMNNPLMVAGALVLITAASFELSRRWTISQPALAYMASPTRAWQFGCGALIALAGPWLAGKGTVLRSLASVVGWSGLAAVVYAAVAFSGKTAYPGLAALVPTLGTGAIILGGSVAGVSGVTAGRLLGVRPMRAVGRLSFAWYLWHWPVLVLVEARFGVLSWPMQVLAVLVAAIPAFATLRLIERPIRFSRVVNTRASSGLAIGVLATVTSVTVGLGVGSVATEALIGGQQNGPAVSLASVFAPSRDPLNSGPTTPSAFAARTDFPTERCIADPGAESLTECRFGKSGSPLAVLLGDSHAHQWQPAFQDLVGRRGWSLDLIAHSGCPLAPVPAGPGQPNKVHCDIWRTKAIARIQQLHPALILVSSYSKYLWKTTDRLPAWDLELNQLRQTGAKIAYIVDTPTPNVDVPVCVSAHLNDWRACSFKRSDAVWRDPVEAAVLAGEEPDVSIIDLTNYLCPRALCPAVRGGVVFYRDSTHITATLARVLQPAMAAALNRDGLMMPPKK